MLLCFYVLKLYYINVVSLKRMQELYLEYTNTFIHKGYKTYGNW